MTPVFTAKATWRILLLVMEGGPFWMKRRSMTTSSTFKALANFAKRAFLGRFQPRKRLLWKRINILSNLKNRVQQLKSEGASDQDISRAKNKVRSYYDSLWRT